MNPILITYAMWIVPAAIALCWVLWEIFRAPIHKSKIRQAEIDHAVLMARIEEVSKESESYR